MTFDEALLELKYSIKERSREIITIVFEDKPSNIIILFDLKNRLIDGMLCPNSAIKNIAEMSHQYALYNKMKDDLKKLEELSGYRRI